MPADPLRVPVTASLDARPAELWRIAVRVGNLPELRLESNATRLAIMGPSGAGKTTLLRMLAGVERRARGVVVHAGERWLDSEARLLVPAWERRVGWSPQDALLLPHLDVRANLLAAAGAHADELDEVAAGLEIAPLLGRRPRHLSGGERHRVALGRALLADAKVLLLDEPFSALDRALRARVLAFLLRHLQARPRALFLVSHDLQDASSLAEEIWELEPSGLCRLESS